MSGEIRVVIADDHPLLRKGLRQVIDGHPNLTVVGEADDGEAALLRIDELKPHIAVLDIDMPRLDGFGVARELNARAVPVEMVFLTFHAKADMIYAAMDLGVKSYILKDSAVLEIVQGLLAVSAGQHYVSPSLTVHLFNRSRNMQAAQQRDPALTTLNESERKILRMISEEKSSKEIADELCLHFRTVENRRTLICQKLGLHGSNALLKFALQHKFEI